MAAWPDTNPRPAALAPWRLTSSRRAAGRSRKTIPLTTGGVRRRGRVGGDPGRAFDFVRLLSAIPITPGGLGVIELGLIAGLVTAGGERPEVAAAVLVYRALTYLLPVPVGVVCYVIWRRAKQWRRAHRRGPTSPTSPTHRSR